MDSTTSNVRRAETTGKSGGSATQHAARHYKPKTLIDLTAIVQAEATIGKGRALITMVISAELATSLVEECNVGNRPIRKNNLAAYSKAMTDSRWGDSTIILGVLDGKLRIGDGQHRFIAQKDSGTTQAYAVWAYTDDAEFQAAVRRVDAKGSSRNVRDLLVIEGLTTAGHGMLIEAAVNKMTMFDGTSRNGITLDLETRLCYAERRLKSLLWAANNIPPRMFKPSVIAGLVFGHVKDPKSTEELVGMVVAGTDLKPNTAAHSFLMNKEDLNLARTAPECRRAIAHVLRLLADHKEGRKSPKKFQPTSLPSQAAVERYAGKQAFVILESDQKRG